MSQETNLSETALKKQDATSGVCTTETVSQHNLPEPMDSVEESQFIVTGAPCVIVGGQNWPFPGLLQEMGLPLPVSHVQPLRPQGTERETPGEGETLQNRSLISSITSFLGPEEGRARLQEWQGP